MRSPASGRNPRRRRAAASEASATLPIFSVLAAIGYIYYTTVFVAVAGWLGLATAAGVANFAAFTALAAACVATYAVAVCRDPGRVSPAFVPDVEDAGSPVHEIKSKDLDHLERKLFYSIDFSSKLEPLEERLCY